MVRTVNAIFEGGIFRPTEPVLLAERQTVRLSFEVPEAVTPAVESARRILQEVGLLGSLSPGLERRIIPGADLAEVRRCLGAAGGKPLSEFIIEQRGDLR